jgi:hypothetical protein
VTYRTVIYRLSLPTGKLEAHTQESGPEGMECIDEFISRGLKTPSPACRYDWKGLFKTAFEAIVLETRQEVTVLINPTSYFE